MIMSLTKNTKRLHYTIWTLCFFTKKKIIKQDDELATSSLQEFHKLAIIIEKDTL